MSENVKEVNKKNFSEIVENSKKDTVIIDFWAPWCGPCRMMSPIFDEISKKFPEISFVKVNIDEENELASNFNVSGIPNFVKLQKSSNSKKFEVVNVHTGSMSLFAMEKWIESK